MAVLSAWPKTSSRDDAGLRGGSTNRDELVKAVNPFLTDFINSVIVPFTGNAVLLATVLARGSTDTNLASTAFTITNLGVPASVAAIPIGTAFGALGTIPASTWGLIAVDAIAAGTITFVSAAANYTSGYATEALAIAANPAKTASKARIGYITILATSSTWVAGTDALAGGSSGNPATTTNYYPSVSVFDTTALTAKQVGNMSGTLISA